MVAKKKVPRKKCQSGKLMAQVAELRAAGLSWEAISTTVHLPASELEEWPRLYRGKWNRHVSAAERQLIALATYEAVVALRCQLRGKDQKGSREAAHKLIQLRVLMDRQRKGKRPVARSRGEAVPTTPREQFAQSLRNLTDSDIESLFQEFGGLSDVAVPAQAGGGDSESSA
jgi:hypothetical protein